MTTLRLRYALFSTLLLGYTACDNGCEQVRESYLHLQFTSTTGRTLTSLSLSAASGNVYTESTSLTSFSDIECSLNPNDSILSLFLENTYTDYGDSFTEIDTLTLTYHTTPYFLDMSCGCTVNYTLQTPRHTTHFLRSVSLTDPTVHPEGGINLVLQY